MVNRTMFTVEQINSFNELEMEVYNYVVEHSSAIPYMRIRELANETHVSTTTILRFCKKIGCDGFSEFKYKYKELETQKNETTLIDDREEIDRFLNERFPSPAFQEQIEQLVSLIAKTDTILLQGIGNSLYVAEYAARCLSNAGKFSVCIADPFYPTRMIPKLDAIVLIISVSGETTQLLEFAKEVKTTNNKLISITSTTNCGLARMADIAISTGVHSQRRNNIDYTTNVPVLYLIEYIAKKLENRKIEE